MKLRASALAFAIALALPAALTQAGLGSALFAEPLAAAQAADPVTEVARQRYGEGVKAFDAGKFEDARSAFLQAYALKRVPAVLLNIGQSEVKSGKHWEEAGNHLEQFLREDTAATPDQKASAQKGIDEAKHRTAYVAVTVDTAGADVSIDGTAIGKSPITDPIFVKPGSHTLVAILQTHSASMTVDAKSGKETPAALTLAIPGVSITPAPVPVPMPVSPPNGSGTVPPLPPPQPPPIPPPMPPQPPQVPPTTPPDQGGTGQQSLVDWYTHKPIAWVGTGVAGVGLIGGIILSVAASSASSSADNHAQQIKTHAATDQTTDFGAKAPCGSESSAGSDLPGYATACTTLRQDLSQYHTDVALAVTGWVLLGVGVAGTVTYALVDYSPQKKQTGRADGPHVSVLPVITPTQQGIGVVGSF